MDNSEMRNNRILCMQNTKRLYNAITSCLERGGEVITANYMHATKYKKKHAGMFKLTQKAVYVQRGKNWDCLTSFDGTPMLSIRCIG